MKTVAEWRQALDEVRDEYDRVRPRDEAGRPIRGDKWDDLQWKLTGLLVDLIEECAGDGAGDSIDFLIDRLLHAAIGHGNDSEFVRGYFRREIQQFVDYELEDARNS